MKMNTPADLLLKLNEEIDITPILFFATENCLNNSALKTIVDNEDISTVLKLLKVKLMLISRRKCERSDFDLTVLLGKLSGNGNMNTVHDVLLYALLIQQSFHVSSNLLEAAYNRLSDVSDKDSQVVLFNLEIIDVILEICILTQNNIRQLNSTIEGMNNLLVNLLCRQETHARRKTTELIPKYIKCTANYDILPALWTALKDDSYLYECVLFVLAEYLMPKCLNNVTFSVLDQPAFWNKLQTKLTAGDPIAKKQATYVLRQGVQIILNNERYTETFTSTLASVPEIMKWNRTQTQECQNAWRNFFIMCDTANEKQLHLLAPTFELYDSLRVLHHTWQRCVTVLYLSHAHSAVIRHAVTQVLAHKWTCDMDTLLIGLDHNFLYDSLQDCPITPELSGYVSQLAPQDFKRFVQLLAKRQPSPVPFYFLCNHLRYGNRAGLNFSTINDLIQSSASVPHLYIRKAIQRRVLLLATKLELTDDHFQDGTLLRELIRMIVSFYNVGYLRQHNAAWHKTRLWLATKKDLCRHSFETVFRAMEQGDFQFPPQHYAIWLVLLHDMLDTGRIYANIMQRVQTTTDCAEKLAYMLIGCHALRVSAGDENTTISFGAASLVNELVPLCLDPRNPCCRTELGNSIAFVMEVMYCPGDVRRDLRDLLLDFLDKLEQCLAYDYYAIVCRKMIQIYGHRDDTSTEDSEPVFRRLIGSLEQVKDASMDNRLNRQILSNYWCAKVWLAKTQLTCDTALCLQELSACCYDTVGADTLAPALDVLRALLDHRSTDEWAEPELTTYCTLLRTFQVDILHLRTHDTFRVCFEKLVSIVTHPHVVCTAVLRAVRDRLCADVFESVHSGTGSRNILLEKAAVEMQLMISVETLVEALLYGPVLRKDQRIEFDACAEITELDFVAEVDKNLINPWELNGKVRSQAVDVLLKVIQHPTDGSRIVYDVLRLLKQKYGQFANKRYFDNSQVHLLKLRVVQTLHLVTDHLNAEQNRTLIGWLVEGLFRESQQFSVKLLMQWLLVRLYRATGIGPEDTVTELLAVLADVPGSSCAAMFPVLFHAIRGDGVARCAAEQCMNALLPYTMGQHFTIRHYAQVAIKHIFEYFQTDKSFRRAYLSVYKTVCDVLSRTTSERSSDIGLNFTHLPLSLETLYYHVPRLTNVTDTEWLPKDYFETVLIGKCTKSSSARMDTLLAVRSLPAAGRSLIKHVLPDRINVQLKLDALRAMDPDNDECDGTATAAGGSVRTDLIVVASLVDRAPNLGGLSRTCEVFGVRQYVLNNAQFVNNKEYQSLSMSSERWVDTVEVRVADLPQYLTHMKRKGYRIVGAEQTADSRRLDTHQFARNTVLVLGNEKEGIAANLIHLLDQCLEIPQFGRIRSLNVHVAGALFVWEYAKQHCRHTPDSV